MSKIKEFYHDQICAGLYPDFFEEEENLEADFDKWKEPDSEIQKKAEEAKAYDEWVEQKAEESEFIRVFEASGRYPF